MNTQPEILMQPVDYVIREPDLKRMVRANIRDTSASVDDVDDDGVTPRQLNNKLWYRRGRATGFLWGAFAATVGFLIVFNLMR